MRERSDVGQALASPASRQGFGEVHLPRRTRAASGTATARASEVSRKRRRSTTRLLDLSAAAARGGIVGPSALAEARMLVLASWVDDREARTLRTGAD
jgi:hypothetical protein